MDSKSQPAKSREDYEDILDVDDNQSWDALRAKGIIDFKHRVSLSDISRFRVYYIAFTLEC